MLPFHFYLKLGFEHISNLAGYDHIMFLVALCAVYTVGQWRHVLILVTAFTIGHSVTLSLATFDVLTIPSEIIKFLIPVTIFITAINNVFSAPPDVRSPKIRRNYFMALFFGFIHGMDFSNYFKALIGEFGSIFQPLLAFNLGIELGQLLVVLGIFLLAYLALTLLKFKPREWNLFISGAAAGMSLLSMIENKFW
ncbi:HupE/UreJ family protein [Fulvivirgaceae bacterium BMA12]|uniref:HupE/UreJ family protein n=1 Tax=Agaribacillus aureus TaxID=3051825 RepID=A0ABT8LFV6_9BACT|nr:HupE/UreJ family protein [Fulvivirgaceae bacterium BMA12]